VNQAWVQEAERIWTAMGGFDLIHAHDWLVSFAAIDISQKFHCPVIATVHATEKGRWRNGHLPDQLARSIDQADQALIAQAWHIIACSRYMVQDLQANFGLEANKITLIPNGVSLAHLPRYDPQTLVEFRAKYALPEQPLIFSVGRLVYEKGQQVLIGAMPQVLERVPEAKLVVAGKGPRRKALQEIIHHLDLEESVQLSGFITDEARDLFFTVADCAAFPSLYEPFGIVALEAMAVGCPVVVSNIGGLAEVVKHRENGIHIYSNNSESTAWGILEILENPQTARQYVAVAQEMVRQDFNWRRIARETKRLYGRVCGEYIIEAV